MASIEPDGQPEALGFVAWLGRMFEQAGVDAVLIGGHARNFWAEPRATLDYDFTAVARVEDLDRLCDAFAAQGYRITGDLEQTRASGPDFIQFRNDATRDSIDLQMAKTDFQSQLVERGVRLVPEQPLRVATVEDLLVLKLIANRTKDRVDIHDLAEREGIDWSYVNHWATVWGVEDLLAEVRSAMDEEHRGEETPGR